MITFRKENNNKGYENMKNLKAQQLLKLTVNTDSVETLKAHFYICLVLLEDKQAKDFMLNYFMLVFGVPLYIRVVVSTPIFCQHFCCICNFLEDPLLT